MSYKIFNKTYQPLIITGMVRIPARSYKVVDKKTSQISNLEEKGFITVRKL